MADHREGGGRYGDAEQDSVVRAVVGRYAPGEEVAVQADTARREQIRAFIARQ